MNHLKVVAQDLSIYDGDGLHPEARTGAISFNHLSSARAEGIILGHSEVGDSPIVINKKLKTIAEKLPNNFSLIILVGESWEEFENKTEDQVADSIFEKCRIIFDNIPEKALSRLTLGYEPKWGSFGSGRDDAEPPKAELISACVGSLMRFITTKYKNINPFYISGGRSTPERTLAILSDQNVDGLILGSACNSVEKTMGIANAITKSKGDKNKVMICNFKAYSLSDSYEKYIQELKKLPDNFFVYLAPPYTDIRLLKELNS